MSAPERTRSPIRPTVTTNAEARRHLLEDHLTEPVRRQDRHLVVDFHAKLHRHGDTFGEPHHHEALPKQSQLLWSEDK